MTTEPRQPATAIRDRTPRSELPPSSTKRRCHRSIDRFVLTYLRREIQGRLAQVLQIALGLGFGVGLVIAVTATSAGVSAAQTSVLHSLYGIGTDLTVAKPAAAATNEPAGNAAGGLPDNTLQSGSLGPYRSTRVASIARLPHVASAAGGLDLSEFTQQGGIPHAIPVAGVDVTQPDLGPLASGTLGAGHNFPTTDRFSDVAVLDANYAATNKLSAGSAVSLAGTTFRVIGLVNQTQASGAIDIYIPLARAQELARSSTGKTLTGRVNVIYVATTTSSETSAVQSEISRFLPTATVTSSRDLANEVSGSLASAADLTNDLGKWAAAAALLAAFAVASLLNVAAINSRIRELGTLKALGWTITRIIIQIMSESAVSGIVGAFIGMAIGFAGATAVGAIAPRLSATIPRQSGATRSSTVAVHLTTHISPTTVLTANLLAVTGALIAGAVGAWRATKLQPADAFTRIG